MKQSFFSAAVLSVVFFYVTMNVYAQKKEKDKLLVNKIYTVEFTETSAKKPKVEADEISFKGEKLNSKFMTSQNHFPASLYTASMDSTSESKEITFSSEGKNTDGEEIKWEGTVTGEAIEGTAVITKKGKTKHEYSFSGNLKPKPGKK